MIEGFLDDVQHFLLNEASFFADLDYEITFCHNAWIALFPAHYKQQVARVRMSLKSYSSQCKRSSYQYLK